MDTVRSTSNLKKQVSFISDAPDSMSGSDSDGEQTQATGGAIKKTQTFKELGGANTQDVSEKNLPQINPHVFFDNQVFLNKDLEFIGQQFYGDGWLSAMEMKLAKASNLIRRIRVMDTLETQQPHNVHLELQQQLEIFRE